MREHMGLYRGKRPDNGEWVEGNLLLDGYDYDTAIWETGTKLVTEVDPDTVSECCGGLRDKNGKLIFEGDIIQLEYTGVNRGVEGKAAVIFESGKFGIHWGWHKELVCLDGFANTTLEIIGNIHDNPELLKGGEGE